MSEMEGPADDRDPRELKSDWEDSLEDLDSIDVRGRTPVMTSNVSPSPKTKSGSNTFGRAISEDGYDGYVRCYLLEGTPGDEGQSDILSDFSYYYNILNRIFSMKEDKILVVIVVYEEET